MSSVPSSTTPTASSIQADYLSLLVTQMQNQDPMQPMDNNQMASQLAQLSQLQEMENMNSTFGKVLASQKMTQATSMLGKNVTFTMDGDSTTYSGTVDRVDVVNGSACLHVGTYEVDPANVQSVTGS
jgi:flagellar basal-body rod modification protein FlgD